MGNATVLRVEVSLDEARFVQNALTYLQRFTVPDSALRERQDGSLFTTTEIDSLRERFT